MMKLGLISSAWDNTPVSLEEGLRKTKEIGFDTVDIFQEPAVLTPQQRRVIREVCREIDLPIVSHVLVSLGIADFNPPVQRFHVERAKRSLDFTHDLGGENLLLVLGETIWQEEVIPPEQQWEWAVQNTRELGKYAADLGLEIAIELEPFRASLVNSMDKMKRFLDDVNNDAVKANVDISHLALVNEGGSRIPELEGSIAHVHISDCNGKVHGDLPPGRGVVNFPEYLQGLKDANFDGVVSIELEYSPEPEKIEAWVREAYSSTERLMDEAGVRPAKTPA